MSQNPKLVQHKRGPSSVLLKLLDHVSLVSINTPGTTTSFSFKCSNPEFASFELCKWFAFTSKILYIHCSWMLITIGTAQLVFARGGKFWKLTKQPTEGTISVRSFKYVFQKGPTQQLPSLQQSDCRFFQVHHQHPLPQKKVDPALSSVTHTTPSCSDFYLFPERLVPSNPTIWQWKNHGPQPLTQCPLHLRLLKGDAFVWKLHFFGETPCLTVRRLFGSMPWKSET